jgi:hypothetical protein
MIGINKYSKLSLSIEFDEEGAKDLLSALKETICMKTAIIQVNNELNGGTVDLEFIQDDDMNRILFNNNKIILRMDTEDIEYTIERLIDSIDSKYFYPAEVCECSQNRKRKDIAVYAHFIKKFE